MEGKKVQTAKGNLHFDKWETRIPAYMRHIVEINGIDSSDWVQIGDKIHLLSTIAPDLKADCTYIAEPFEKYGRALKDIMIEYPFVENIYTYLSAIRYANIDFYESEDPIESEKYKSRIKFFIEDYWKRKNR